MTLQDVESAGRTGQCEHMQPGYARSHRGGHGIEARIAHAGETSTGRMVAPDSLLRGATVGGMSALATINEAVDTGQDHMVPQWRWYLAPVSPHKYIQFEGWWPCSEAEWNQMMAVLNAMKPGLVR